MLYLQLQILYRLYNCISLLNCFIQDMETNRRLLQTSFHGVGHQYDNDPSSNGEDDGSTSSFWDCSIILLWITFWLTPRNLNLALLILSCTNMWSFKYGTTCFFISSWEIPRWFPGTLMKWTFPASSRVLKPIQSSM